MAPRIWPSGGSRANADDKRLREKMSTSSRILSEDVRLELCDKGLFLHCCLYGDKDMLKLILQDKDFDVNQPGYMGFTGLQAAVDRGHSPVVQLLIDNRKLKSDIYQENDSGETSLEIAIVRQEWNIACILMKHSSFKWSKVQVNRIVYSAVVHEW